MTIKLFTDLQKSTLATEAGVQNPSSDSFNRDFNPNTGEATMYMKIGDNQKFYGASPTKRQLTPLESQVTQMKDTYNNMPIETAYQAMLSSQPESKAVLTKQLGISTGIYDNLDALRQQQVSILRSMTGDQSAIFKATNPDGTPVDPRVMVAQYQANMKSNTERVGQLRQLEDVYTGQLTTLAEAEYSVMQKKNEQAKTAILYLKELNDQTNKEATIKIQQQNANTTQSRANKVGVRSGSRSPKISQAEKTDKELRADISREVGMINDTKRNFDSSHAIIYAKYSGYLKDQGLSDEQTKNAIHKALGGN